MKILSPILISLVAFFVASSANAEPTIVARHETKLNSDWSFHFGDTPGAEGASFDASSWSHVEVPHTWNALDGQDGVKTATPGSFTLHGDYARGTGWYRRVLKPDVTWAGKQLYLQFDGSNRRTDVFVNGQLIRTHLGGHARFRFDVTTALKADRDNVLSVKVNNEDNGIIPQSGDFTFFGGLYRDVAL